VSCASGAAAAAATVAVVALVEAAPAATAVFANDDDNDDAAVAAAVDTFAATAPRSGARKASPSSQASSTSCRITFSPKRCFMAFRTT
jgi:hypothetical protein